MTLPSGQEMCGGGGDACSVDNDDDGPEATGGGALSTLDIAAAAPLVATLQACAAAMCEGAAAKTAGAACIADAGCPEGIPAPAALNSVEYPLDALGKFSATPSGGVAEPERMWVPVLKLTDEADPGEPSR